MRKYLTFLTYSKLQLLNEFISFALIVLFIYAGISKLMDHTNFVNQLQLQMNTPYLPEWISYLVPFAEILFALLLVSNNTRRIGYYALLFILTGFTIYIIAMLFSDKKLPCSCGGVISRLTWKQHILFNMFFLILSITGIIIESKKIQRTKQASLFKIITDQ